MSRTKSMEKVKLTRFDDLFGTKEEKSSTEAGEVKEVEISRFRFAPMKNWKK